MKKIARKGVFEKGEVLFVRDARGNVVERWLVKHTRNFNRKQQLDEVKFAARDYRDVATL